MADTYTHLIGAERVESAARTFATGVSPAAIRGVSRRMREVNTPAELAAWKAACEAWERGEGQDTGPQCQTMGDGSVVTGTGFGMGVTRWTHPAVEAARAALAKAEALHA